jgi:hypothetical protein
MPDAILIRRIEILERKVEGLELLPARMTALESQILQLRDDMRVEFSATRQELTAAVDGVRLEIRTVDQDIRREMHSLLGEVVARLELRISSGDEETRRYMRVLHEDFIERISRIQEGPPSPSRRRKR